MLNKPKFMSPSINMYGNSVIDINSDKLPFSCIVDGNESITSFQIIVYRLKDNVEVLNTDMQELTKTFFPVNNRNQNVTFEVNLKDYIKADSKFKNSSDAYYWTITLKNKITGTTVFSSAEVFYANSVPFANIQIQTNNDIGTDNYKNSNNNLVYNGETLRDLIGWSKDANLSYTNKDDGCISITSLGTWNSGTNPCRYTFKTPITGGTEELEQRIYCSVKIRGYNTNSSTSSPRYYLSTDKDNTKFVNIGTENNEINDGNWHFYSKVCTTWKPNNNWEYFAIAIGIDSATVGDTYDFKDVCVFNLTEIYGKGKEPSKEWCDKNIDSLRIATINSKKCKFCAEYIQNQKVQLKRYGWRLTDTTNDYIILDTITQNQIYGTEEDISCSFGGLINGTSYLLELYIETQAGYFDVLKSINFNVDYPTKNIEADFDIVSLDNTAGIMLDWGNLRTTEGIVVGGEVSYIENYPVSRYTSVKIPSDTSIVFAETSSGKNLQIDENSYVVLSFRLNKSKNTVIYEMTGYDEQFNDISRRLIYSSFDRKLKYIISKNGKNSSYECELNNKSELCWYVITMYPLINDKAYFRLVESVAKGGLFPTKEDSTTKKLYPSTNKYPKFGKWDSLKNNEVV